MVCFKGQFGPPLFNTTIFVGFLVAVISSILETIGDYHACAHICHAPPPPPHAVNRGVLLEGIGSVISGAMGAGHATTSSTANLVLVSISKVRFYSSKGNNFIHQPGPIYSKHHQLNELVNDKLVICCSLGIFKYVDIFVAKATHIFFWKKFQCICHIS